MKQTDKQLIPSDMKTELEELKKKNGASSRRKEECINKLRQAISKIDTKDNEVQ